MGRLAIVIALGLATASTARGDVPLGDYHKDGVVVRVPVHWVVTVDAKQGSVLAQQDPKRKDAAALMLVLQKAGPTASEDALIDAVVSRAVHDAKPVERGPLPGGHGRGLIADGTSDGVAVRIAAIAVVANGVAYLGVLAATPADFDTLGGARLVVSALAGTHAEGGMDSGIEKLARQSKRTDQPDLDPGRPALAKAVLGHGSWLHTDGYQFDVEDHQSGNTVYGHTNSNWGTERFEFHKDGTYQLTRLDKLVLNSCHTGSYRTEVGSYTMDGHQLVLVPKQAWGIFSICGGKQQREALKVTAKRVYEVGLMPDGFLAMVGPSCSSFGDPQCYDHARWEMEPGT
ncbi:MAG TPA: hypothetical protein VMJ10_10560 [Kofleriaceae bacterium]|nr:hypothetical protein [Kofleriaceae bacterium]